MTCDTRVPDADQLCNSFCPVYHTRGMVIGIVVAVV